MCLAIPLKVKKIYADRVTLENGSEVKTVSIRDLGIGDYLLVQQGVALQKLSKKEALRARRVLKDILNTSSF